MMTDLVYGASAVGVLGLGVSAVIAHNVREYTRGMHRHDMSHAADLPYWSRTDGWILPPKWRQHRYDQRSLEDDSI